MENIKETNLTKETNLNDLNSFISEFTTFIDLVYKDYLLSKRIEFKVIYNDKHFIYTFNFTNLITQTKNQFRNQKQFKYLQEFNKKLLRHTLNTFIINSKIQSGNIVNYLKKTKLLYCSYVEEMKNLIVKFGSKIKSMLKLKLHPSYCILILGILS